MTTNQPLIIGLVGTSGSGKTTAASHLKKRGYHLITLSHYIRKKAKEDGYKKISKRLLQDLGNQMRVDLGPQILAQLALEEIGEGKIKKAVIDGIRNPHEITFLEDTSRFFLLGINAQSRVRYQRIIQGKNERDVVGFKDFLTIEKRDSDLGEKEVGLRVNDCLKKAIKTIENDSTLKEFYFQIDQFIKAVSHKKKPWELFF